MNKKRKPNYALLVEWSDEDQCYIGRCPELFGGGVHGKDRRKVYAELCEAVDEVLEDAAKSGVPLPEAVTNKSYSGKFIIRVDPGLHKLLVIRALQEGDSLNSFVAKKLQSA